MKRRRTRAVYPKYKVGQHVQISKHKFRFAKGAETNYSTNILTIAKVIKRQSRPVYELQDFCHPIVGQFFQEELTPIRISVRTVYIIH
jgi:hypothetical protein